MTRRHLIVTGAMILLLLGVEATALGGMWITGNLFWAELFMGAAICHGLIVLWRQCRWWRDGCDPLRAL